MTTRSVRSRKAQQGLTLVELMVASVIALAITAALTGVFVNNSRARTELDRSSRQIENGRYALELISEELRLAGFYAEVPLNGATYAVAGPCVLTAADLGWQVSPVRAPAPVQVVPAAAADSGCLADRVAGPASSGGVVPPALSVRRMSTDTVAPGAIVSPNEYVQTSSCKNDPPATSLILSRFAVDFTLRNLACSSQAPVRRVVQRTYYLASCSNCGIDTIPSLKRVELVGGALQLQTLAEGIEAIGLDLGFDTDGDGTPDAWRLDVDGMAGSPTNDWANVMVVRLHVLSRTTEATAGYQDTRVYDLGLAGTVGPFNDGFKRRVYSTVVRLNNPAGRREL